MPAIARVLALAGLISFAATTGKAQRIQVSPNQITFQRTAYTLIPPEQPPVQILELHPLVAGDNNAPFRLREIQLVNLPSGGPTNFVIVSPAAGFTRATSLIILNPKIVPYMRPGIYELLVVFENPERPDLSTSAVRVRLRLDVPGIPEIASVVNAASMRPGISPGELVTIRGTHLSSPPVTGEVDSAGLFPKLIGNTRVTFNGMAAPLLYVSTGQINCVVPHGVAGSKTAQVIVELTAEGGSVLRSPAVTVPVSDTSPGIFTADQSGSGPGLILNTGAGTGWNEESNPAPKGASITLYATGAGAWNVPYPDGSLVIWPDLALPPPSPRFLVPVAEVSLTIGGQPARVLTARAQRMRVSGMLEVTAEIPEGAGSGPQAVVLKVGENDNSDQNVSVWVR